MDNGTRLIDTLAKEKTSRRTLLIGISRGGYRSADATKRKGPSRDRALVKVNGPEKMGST